MAGRPSILVVEDTEPLRMILELALAGAGYEVIGAASGAEALRWGADRRFDAALLDINLPDMDGFELAARLRAGKEGGNPADDFHDRPAGAGDTGAGGRRRRGGTAVETIPAG